MIIQPLFWVLRGAADDGCLVLPTRAALTAGPPNAINLDAVAQALALDTLRRLAPADAAEDLVRACWVANQALRTRSQVNGPAPMTSMLAIDLLHERSGPSVTIASVGSNSLYRRRKSHVRRVTAGSSPITPCLGERDIIDVEAWSLDLEPDDEFLLCNASVASLGDETIAALWPHGAGNADELLRAARPVADAQGAPKVLALGVYLRAAAAA